MLSSRGGRDYLLFDVEVDRETHGVDSDIYPAIENSRLRKVLLALVDIEDLQDLLVLHF